MSRPALTDQEMAMIGAVFRRHPEVSSARLFGSRAVGTHTMRSDVDLAVWGCVDALGAASIAAELDELPLPYHFDVQPFGRIRLPALREHIACAGIEVYPEPRRPGLNSAAEAGGAP